MHIIKIYKQEMRQNPLLNHIGTPSQKSRTERIMPETNQNRIPAVRMTCIVRDMLLVSRVRRMRIACGTWHTAIQMPAIEEVIVNGSMYIKKYYRWVQKSHSINEFAMILCGRMKEHRSLLRKLFIVYILIAVHAEHQIVIWQQVLIFCLANGADNRI